MGTVSVLLDRKGSDVFSVDVSASCTSAARELARRRVGALLVLDRPPLERDRGVVEVSSVLGVVSERDLVSAFAASGVAVFDAAVSEVMSSPVSWAEPSTPVAELAELMTSRRIRHLPVRDGDVVVGVVSIGDAVAWHLSELSRTTELLSQYVSTGRG